MKILHLTTHLNMGGVTQYILNVASVHQGCGHTVQVASAGGNLEEAFRQEGISIFQLPVKTKSELHPKLAVALMHLIAILRREPPDVIHCHTRVAQVLGALAAGIMHTPLVTTCHGFFKRRLGRQLFPAWGDRVIAISKPVAQSLQRDFDLSEKMVRVVLNGVNIERLTSQLASVDEADFKRQIGVRQDNRVIGIVSRVTEDKGFSFLVEAFSRLHFQDPTLILCLVGEGPYLENIKKLVADLKLEDCVRYFGFQENIAPFYRAMDVFVFPCIGPEGFGLVVAEAMALGCPIIVSDQAPLNELVQNGRTGILVQPRDAADLANKISYLLSDRVAAKSMASAAAAHARKNFSLDRMADQIMSVYEEVALSASDRGRK